MCIYHRINNIFTLWIETLTTRTHQGSYSTGGGGGAKEKYTTGTRATGDTPASVGGRIGDTPCCRVGSNRLDGS